MRKFPQPACFVFALWALLGCVWAAGNQTTPSQLDSALAWKFVRGDAQLIAVARLKRGGLTATSANGTDWQIQKIIAGFNAVTHGQDKFIAVGENGAVGITTNGANWRIISIGTNELCAVFYEGGVFVASTCAPARELFTSRDGFIWKRQTVLSAAGINPAFGRILETAVTVTNTAAERSLTSIANEVRTLCRHGLSGK
jgi:hypothetical protein